jgi:hypothetical protein
MLATEIMVKKIPVRVNSIAPGVYASEITMERIGKEQVDRVGKGLMPVPMERDGS